MQIERRPLLAAALALVAAPAGAQTIRPASMPAAMPPAIAPGLAPTDALLKLVDRLLRLEEDGLDPRHYAIPDSSLAASDPAAYRTALHAASAAALSDLLLGRVRDMPGRPDLRRDISGVNMEAWLADLATTPDPAALLDRAALRPQDAAALKAELARQRQIAAQPWSPIPGDATIDPGMVDAQRVPLLRARLAVEDPVLAAAPDAGALYDRVLEDAVRRWQAANGLEVDGRVGRISLGLLNRPLTARVDQLRVALDMRRAAAPPPAERRVDVNVPDYRLRVMEGERELLAMAVIVGRPDRATPMMAVRLTAIQFNPPWGVPERNAREDLLPRFRRDPQAMMERGFRVFTVVGGERMEIDPRTIDWSSINGQRFPYFVRQDAGDSSALGRLKFIMPNNEDIFLHDTPDRHLFRRPDRAFSSGCIRLAEPNQLMALLLSGTPGWDLARAERALASRATSVVSLSRSLPVRLHYHTVMVEAGGRVRIRPDIYRLDAAYARAMANVPRLVAGLSRPAASNQTAAR
ncbi:L,D-transpeptidase family protein [Falsiroseomonas tokyonensis]|uniref:Murein L,D-transpeptidase n=1 Tax=Falsiroseomonas tokyonensis TaxID=430521 RepID=A0ABV7C3Q5_9PROT|nr:L,D-transpeptidase family protein [Falsiroseomonas tokyonensis]